MIGQQSRFDSSHVFCPFLFFKREINLRGKEKYPRKWAMALTLKDH
jgi:hypothetical protein